MAARLQLALAAVLGIVALALAGVLVFGGSKDDDGATTPSTINGLRGFAPPPDVPRQDFTLTDQDGKRVSLASYRGKVVVLTFLYSNCQDSCPVIAQQIRAALNTAGHQVPVLAVSVDPANDTRASAKDFLIKQSMLGRMEFLMGSKQQLQPIWKGYGIQPQLGGGTKADPKFDHSAYVLLIDKQGRRAASFPFNDLVPDDLAHDIATLDDKRV